MGDSTIDLAWVNLPFVNVIDKFRLNRAPSHSDHHPVTLNVNVSSAVGNVCEDDIAVNTITMLTWAPDNLANYIYFLENALAKETFYPNNPINIQNDTLISALSSAAADSHMSRTVNNKPNRNYKKPWYNSHCKSAKNEMNFYHKQFINSNYDPKKIFLYISAQKKYEKIIKKKKIVTMPQ